MSVNLLTVSEGNSLRASPLTFEPWDWVGEPPDGFTVISRRTRLTRRDFDGASRDLCEWRVHARAGLRVAASDIPAELGSVVLMRLGIGGFSLRIPCRVLEVIEEPRRRGFAYGTLPGHPESGEERFVVEQEDDGSLSFCIDAYSRPASTLARLGGPVSPLAQRVMTTRYLKAIDAG